MKKIFSLALILVLAFGLIGCSDVGLKDEDEAGFGTIIVNNPVDSEEENIEDAIITLDGETKDSNGFTEKIEIGSYNVSVEKYRYETYEKNISLKAGDTVTVKPELVLLPTEDVTLTLKDSDGVLVPQGVEVGINVADQDVVTKTTNENGQVIITELPTADLEFNIDAGDYGKLTDSLTVEEGGDNIFNLTLNPATNAWKVIFDPSVYGLDSADINEVHLVGDNFGWDPAVKTYSLIKQDDGTFTGVFEVATEGSGFKFIYDGDNWDNQIGDNGEPGDGGSGNITIGSTDETTQDF